MSNQMKTWPLAILILFACLSGLAQETKPKVPHLTRMNWRRQALKTFRQKEVSAVVSNYQAMIDFGRSRNKFGMVIYYQLLLGEQYEKMNDYALAEGFFTQAYQEAKKHQPLKHHKYYLMRQTDQKTFFDPVDRLGYFYLTIGNFKRAKEFFQESKTLRDGFFPSLSIHRVHPIIGMGSYYFKKGQYDKTYMQFNTAQRMMSYATTTGYDFDNLNRLFLNDMVELCMILHKEKEALRFLNQLAIASSGFGKFGSSIANRMEVARVFELKSRYYLTLGNFKKAKEYLDKAYHYHPANVTASVVKLKLLKIEALLHWYQGRLDEAALTFQKLVNEYRQHIQGNFASMSDYEREQFYYTLKNDFDLFNSFVAQNPAQASATLYGEMYTNILNTKALLLNETNRLKKEILRSGNQTLIDKLQQWEEAKDQLASLYFEKNTPEKIEALEKSIEDLEGDINQASGMFQNKVKALSWQDVKANLKTGEAAIEIVRVNTFNKNNTQLSTQRNGLTDSVVYAILLITSTSAQPECFLLPNGNKLENHFLPFYRNSILSKTEDKISYDNFWRSIKTHLTGINRIYLSADGVFNQINLNTLQNPVTGNYLIDEIELVLVTNTVDLLAIPSPSKSKEAFLVGRPAFEFSDKQISTALSSPTVSLHRGMRGLAKEELINFKDQNFADLPGTAEEVSKIGDILRSQKMEVTSYTGINAIEENVKGLKNPDILHLATHGFFINDSASSINPMIRSGIILAGVRNDNEGKEDGILTAYEATNLDLEGTSLVTLSACQTGLGEVRNGEGVYGLQRSIIVAGAKNLVMSLWKVDDEATAKLMSIFYQLRSEKNNLNAFREAQIELRKIYPEPFYWGAFVMLGK